MRRLLLAMLMSAAYCAQAATFYVAPNGSDENAGTKARPFATVQKAQSVMSAGDTTYLRGGTYNMTEAQIAHRERGYACVTNLDKSGSEGNLLHYFAYPGERPVFDYSAVKPANLRVAAFYVKGSYIHLKGFEVVGVQVTIKGHTQSECFENRGNHNIYEQLSMHDGMAIGLYLIAGGDNLILNCDAYRNFDYFSENGRGGNTDGFGSHPQAGDKNNVFRGCRAWFNSDDGFDCINAGEATMFDHCWAMYNGFDKDFKNLADGNGFKAGGYARRPGNQVPDPVPQNTVQFCLAVRNKSNGFYANHHVGGSFWYNNSAYQNTVNFNMLNRLREDVMADVPGFGHKMRNNLGYQGKRETDNISNGKNDSANNYFDLDITISDRDFLNLDEAQLIAPRKADGSLPDVTFMQLRKGSKLIDKGQNIGFPYKGKAPDLGCFEAK